MVLQLKIGVLRSFILHWSFLYFFSRMKIPMSKIRGFNGNKNDFIHALRAGFFFFFFFFVLFFFLMLSVNDKTEHLKGNVMYI